MTEFSKRMLVLAILIAALCLRLNHIGFGLPAINDPDELMFELGALRMLRSHSLNPGWFGHPATTTMYLLSLINMAVYLVGHALGRFLTVRDFAAAAFTDPGLLILPGRVAMALFGTASVALTARMAGALFGPVAAVLAALLLAVSPVAVGWSQIVRSDVMATVFMQMGLLASLRYYRDPSRRDLIKAAMWLGVAVATKWPFAMGGAAMPAILIAQTARRRLAMAQAIRAMIGFSCMALVTLLLVSPYLVLAHDVVIRNLAGEVQVRHLGATGGTPLENLLWYLGDPLRRAMGVGGLALAAVGVALSARSAEARVLVLPVLAGFVALLIFQHLVWERWALPLLPLLSLAAARALTALAEYGVARWLRPGSSWILAGILGGALALPLAAADLVQARARTHDTRQQASAWAIRHMPPGSTVMIEHFGFDLYAQPWRLLFPLGKAGCLDAKGLLHGKVDYGAIEQGRARRSNVDYGTMAPARAATCRADFAILSQYGRYAAESADFPEEYAAYRRLLAQGRIVAIFRAEPGKSTGPVIHVLSFEKNMIKM